MTTPRLLAVCLAGTDLFRTPGRPNRSGIDKRPVEGRVAVHPLGLDGDVQVNRKHHGGEGQAVYAYGQEDAEWWERELGRELPPGRFGENLRTAGVDLTHAVFGERWRIGTSLLEVSAPRTPCATFAGYWGVPDLVRRFADHGATGAYLRVLETGGIAAGDGVEIVHRPEHGITLGECFRITTRETSRIPELEPVLPFLPGRARSRIAAKIAARSAAPV